jgi:protein-tyrosine kinase
VSLIESALERLRRTGELDAVRIDPGARASAAKAPGIPLPLPDNNAKRISLNTMALRAAGYLPEEGLERRFADHYRLIKRPLVERALTGSAEMRLIVISSALPGDGKTFTSLNLALSMARERDVSVLLVDADTPRARISEVLGIRRELGLLDALRDETVDVESLIIGTDIRGFELLPAGKLVENATELLASARMQQIATRLGARNSRRIVIFDSPPILVSSEARAIVRVPGQVVLVARTGVTPTQALLDAAAQIDRTKIQGLILNHAPFRQAGGYYGYGSYGAAGDDDSGRMPSSTL